MIPLRGLASPAEAGSSAVKDDVGGLERDVAEDVDADAGAGLDAAEAGAAAVGGVVDVGAGDDDAGGADAEGEVGQGRAAGEHVAAGRVVVLGPRDLRPVGADDGAGEVQKGCAGVGDAVDAARLEGAAAHGVAGRAKLPETLARAHCRVCDGAGVLGGVDEAKVIGTG